MRKSTVMVAALVAAAMTVPSCTSDVLVDQAQQADPIVSFHPLINNSTPANTTRGVGIATSANLTDDDKLFDVWAFADKLGNRYIMGKDATEGYKMILITPEKEELLKGKYGKGGNMVIDQAKAAGIPLWIGHDSLITWPTTSQWMQFYAVSPSISQQPTNIPNLTPDIQYGRPRFDYTAEETVVAGTLEGKDYQTSHTNMRDFLVTGDLVDLSTVNHVGVGHPVYMNVGLTFRHALAQVKFEGKLAENYPNLEITVHSITLCNLVRSDSCQLSTDGRPTWLGVGDKIRNAYTVMTPGDAAGSGITLTTTTGADGNAVSVVPLSNGTTDYNSDNIMIIPQTLLGWRPTQDGKPEADTQQRAYLKILMEAKQRGQALLDGKQYVYVPFGGYSDVSWDGELLPGHSYTFTLVFGLGRDSDGNPNGEDITFSVSIGNGWDTGTTTNPVL